MDFLIQNLLFFLFLAFPSFSRAFKEIPWQLLPSFFLSFASLSIFPFLPRPCFSFLSLLLVPFPSLFLPFSVFPSLSLLLSFPLFLVLLVLFAFPSGVWGPGSGVRGLGSGSGVFFFSSLSFPFLPSG